MNNQKLRLGLATVTNDASMALMLDDQVVSLFGEKRQIMDDYIVVIDRLFEGKGFDIKDLQEIIVVNGPGGYAGIRSSVTIAKTLSYVFGFPIKTVSSVELLAYQARLFKGLILVAMSSRRDEVNFGVFGSDGKKLNDILSNSTISIDMLISKTKQIEGDFLIVGDIDVTKLSVDLQDKFRYFTPSSIEAIRLAESKEVQPLEYVNPIYAYPVNIG